MSLDPATPEAAIEYVLDKIDLILVMTWTPASAGRRSSRAKVDKVRAPLAMIAGARHRLSKWTAALRPTPRRSGRQQQERMCWLPGSAMFRGGAGAYAANIGAHPNSCLVSA